MNGSSSSSHQKAILYPSLSSRRLLLLFFLWAASGSIAIHTPQSLLQACYLYLRALLAPRWLASCSLLLPGEWHDSYPVVCQTYRLLLCLILWSLVTWSRALLYGVQRAREWQIPTPFEGFKRQFSNFWFASRWVSNPMPLLMRSSFFQPILRPILWGASGFFLIQITHSIATDLLPNLLSESLNLPHSPPSYRLPLALMLINLILLTPLVEELLFRFWLQNWLSRRLTLYLSIPLSSIAFALAHGMPGREISWVDSSSLLTLGIWFGLCYATEKRISCVIVTHAIYNALAVGLIVA